MVTAAGGPATLGPPMPIFATWRPTAAVSAPRLRRFTAVPATPTRISRAHDDATTMNRRDGSFTRTGAYGTSAERTMTRTRPSTEVGMPEIVRASARQVGLLNVPSTRFILGNHTGVWPYRILMCELAAPSVPKGSACRAW